MALQRGEALMHIGRRGLLGGFLGLIAAPAIVKIENIMPVASLREPSVKAPPIIMSGSGPGLYACGFDKDGNWVQEFFSVLNFMTSSDFPNTQAIDPIWTPIGFAKDEAGLGTRKLNAVYKDALITWNSV